MTSYHRFRFTGPSLDASQPACGDAGHAEQTADAGKDVGDEMQAVAGDRGAEGQPEQAGGEDSSDVAEGLELAASSASEFPVC